MASVHNHFPLFLLLLLPCFLTVCLAGMTKITSISTDQLALVALRSSITEPASRQILAENWTTDSSVCDWIGVSCGSSRQYLRVTALNISNMNLTGTLPPHLGNLSFLVSLDLSFNNFNGGLPHEFAGLRRLKALNLNFNQLNGKFPPWIGSLQELEYLSILNNSFNGVIPQSISNISKLTTLTVSYNQLQGSIPTEIFNMSTLEWISMSFNAFSPGLSSLPEDMCRHLPRLKRLGLSQVGLMGQIPSSIGQCFQLQRLDLSSNSLNGGIPRDIGNLTGIQLLYLGNNRLGGEIPKEIGNSSMLQCMNFTTNNLKGTIPKEIGNLSMLQEIDFSTNQLTGVIPGEIGKLSSIQYINFLNNILTGSIPEDIFNISTITMINFEGNHLSGALPSTMGYTLPNLRYLFLAINKIDGVIPNSISNCSNLEVLELSDNNFSGPIPNSLGDLCSLQCLHLQNNELTSDASSHVLNFIYDLANCSKFLMDISLENNPLDAIFPDPVGNFSSPLQRIYAAHCKIRGHLPNWIGNLESLYLLEISGNQLIGSLPNSMKNLQSLERLDIRRNRMSISLEFFCTFQMLGYLSLGENLIIGGAIPDCLGNVTSMRNLYLSSTGLNSALPVSLFNLSDLMELNLSSNSLSGSIPPGINMLKSATWMDFSNNIFSGDIPSTIGELQYLQNLSLAHNQLQGQIPETIGQMLSLKRLDLSHNLLSGSLPTSTEKLQYLTSFNVSYNKLSGEIPLQSPYTNLPPESFISNPALCGAERFHVPPCSSGRGNMHKMLIILVVVISIAGVICLGFICLWSRRKGKVNQAINGDQKGFSPLTDKRISYYKLLEATEGYSQSNLLGSGSFGSVHKGILEDGSIVAVKVFNLQKQGSFMSFDTECEVLRNLRHRNLTKVISSCSNPDFKALVLQYMPNGSLDKWLYSSNYVLSFMQRLDILIDVACALEYLHCGISTPVAHCDLKPGNVLLDHEMIAHVSDFGMAKLLGHEDCITFTKTLATLCYLAPEYASEGIVSTRCDIYSFGIMMMEVFTGKSPTDEMFGENLSIRSWVQDSLPDNLANVIDVNLLSTFDHNVSPEILSGVSSIMCVALNCTKVSPKERGNIDEVLASLNKIRLQLLQYADDLKRSGDFSTN